MVGSTRARRRLSLLAGSSLVVATLASTMSVALLAPTAAQAANECGGVNPATNGATADTYDCTGSQTAISYTTSGNLTLRMNNGVATTTGGVGVTSSGTDSVTINRVDTPAGSGDPQLVATGGPGVSVVSTGTGAISVDLSDPDTGDAATLLVSGTTFGARLTGGATTGNAVALTTTNGQIAASAGIGVQAISNSTAAGNIALTLGSGVSGTTGAIQTTIGGTGTQTVSLTAQSSTVSGGAISATAGPAIQMLAGSGTGAATLTVGGGRLVQGAATTAVIDFNTAAGARTITNNGVIRSSDGTTPTAAYDDLAISVGSGTGAVTIANTSLTTTNTATSAVYATATLSGRLTLLNTGTATITNGAAATPTGGSVWHTAGTSTLGLGNTTLNNNTTTFTPTGGNLTRVNAVIATGAGGVATTFDFGAGADVFTNAGTLAAGEGPAGASTLTFQGLETWNNSGAILFGSNAGFTSSDGAANDRIVAATTYTGSSLSKLVMDVDFAGAQDGCSTAATADCFDLRGSTVGGVTTVVVNPVGTARGLGKIVLIDASGGFAVATNFTLDPTTPGYTSDGTTASIDGGILHYDFRFDAAAEQFYLIGAPDTEAMEPGMFASFARGVWDLATGVWSDRGLDLRGAEPASSRGVWLRMAGSFTDHAISQSFSLGGVTTTYDTGYDQDAVALVGGIDLIQAANANSAWVLGVTAGHVTSDVGFNVSPSSVNLKGYTLGAYSSFIIGPLFLDAIVNTAKFDVVYEMPNFGASIDDGEATSMGFQVEGGWRFNVPDMPAYIEPLAALSYVRTQFDDIALPEVEATFENTGDFRAGLGLRVAADAVMEGWTTRFAFTGRVWEEFDGESEVTLTGAALDLPITYDDPSDRLGEVGFAVNALGLGERMSLNLGARMQFKRGYENRQFNVSARYAF